MATWQLRWNGFRIARFNRKDEKDDSHLAPTSFAHIHPVPHLRQLADLNCLTTNTGARDEWITLIWYNGRRCC